LERGTSHKAEGEKTKVFKLFVVNKDRTVGCSSRNAILFGDPSSQGTTTGELTVDTVVPARESN
jgi:hypothetical protein